MDTRDLGIKQRKYKDKSARVKMLNRTLLSGLTVFYFIFGGFTVYDLFHDIIKVYAAIPIIVGCVVFSFVSWFMYFKDFKREPFHYIIVSEYLLIYAAIFLLGKTDYINFQWLRYWQFPFCIMI